MELACAEIVYGGLGDWRPSRARCVGTYWEDGSSCSDSFRRVIYLW